MKVKSWLRDRIGPDGTVRPLESEGGFIGQLVGDGILEEVDASKYRAKTIYKLTDKGYPFLFGKAWTDIFGNR